MSTQSDHTLRRVAVFVAGIAIPLALVWLGAEDFRIFKSDRAGPTTNQSSNTPRADVPKSPAPSAGNSSPTPTTSQRPRHWPLGETPSSEQILGCIRQVAREQDSSYKLELGRGELDPADVGQSVTLRIKIDDRDEGYYLWVRDASCTPRKVMELQPGDSTALVGAWTGGYASLIPFTGTSISWVGQEGPINPDVSWTGGASYQREATTMLWSWS